MNRLVDDDTFHANTILARVLKATTHHKRHDRLEIHIMTQDHCIFTAQLQNDWGEGLRGRLHDFATNGCGTCKDYLVYERVGTQCLSSFRHTCNCSNQVGVVSMNRQGLLNDASVVSRTPGRVFGNLPDYSVSCHNARNDVVYRIMKGIVPGCDRHNQTQGFVLHPSRLVHHHRASGTGLGTQPDLPPLANGTNFLASRQHFSHQGINLRFSRFSR
mmetsp:Transcript_106577/g.159447  ORF Transcript_106577/g.159447 Transcript_106577/m.159447 type:complete len:216 (+) Transcript_106577:755-1402(+)